MFVGTLRLELRTFGVSDRCANQLRQMPNYLNSLKYQELLIVVLKLL